MTYNPFEEKRRLAVLIKLQKENEQQGSEINRLKQELKIKNLEIRDLKLAVDYANEELKKEVSANGRMKEVEGSLVYFFNDLELSLNELKQKLGLKPTKRK